MTTKAAADAARLRAEIQRYERDHDIVPGTSARVGGGVSWEGLARMALARLPEDRTEADVEALRQHPHPRCSLTGRPMQERSPAELDEIRRHVSFADQRAADAEAGVARDRADID